MSGEETQAAANARETLDNVLAAALRLACRAVEHVDAHDFLGAVTVRDKLDCGGYAWELDAIYPGGAFVRVSGTPQVKQERPGICTSVEELAAVMQSDSARFAVTVPRAWAELAMRAASEFVELALAPDEEARER